MRGVQFVPLFAAVESNFLVHGSGISAGGLVKDQNVRLDVIPPELQGAATLHPSERLSRSACGECCTVLGDEERSPWICLDSNVEPGLWSRKAKLLVNSL